MILKKPRSNQDNRFDKMIRVLLLFLIINYAAHAQHNSGKVKVFIEGEVVDFDYLRRSVDIVDYVNDQKVCEVYILVTRTSTANGQQYKLNYEGRNHQSIAGFTLICDIVATDTDDIQRNKFKETLISGLLPFINNLNPDYQVSVSRTKKENENIQDIVSLDPWNNWIFSIELKGGFEAEERKKEYSYETSLSANRVTETWRILNEYTLDREETVITTEDENGKHEIHSLNQEQNYRSKIVYTITDHWSVGMLLSADQDTYRNIKGCLSPKPALEYNFFNWREVDRRLFTVAYYVGPEFYRYYENTILNRLNEKRIVHTIKSQIEVVQTWGSFEFWLEGSQYLQDLEYHLIETGCELSVRVARGLFVELGLEVKKINNQFYLPSSELSEEDLLLNLRKLPTSFEMASEIGLRYTFGSMFNSIVNERL